MPTIATPPSPPGKYYLAHTLGYLRDPLGFFTRCAREFGDIVTLRVFPWLTTYLLSHPEDIEFVLRKEARLFQKDRFTRQLGSLLGEGLLLSEGSFWRKQRQRIQPAFRRDRILEYSSLMVEAARRSSDTWRPGNVIDVHQQMTALTLDIVARSLFSVDARSDSSEVRFALEDVMHFFLSPVDWITQGYLPTATSSRYRTAVRRLDRIIARFIAERKTMESPPDDLLTRLLFAEDEHGERMNDRLLRDELMTLFLAGHETTALVLTYTLHLLGKHPEVQARVVDEIQSTVACDANWSDASLYLPFIEHVILESMRLYPPAWGLAREAVEDCRIGDFDVPKGTQIEMSQWVVHRDPRWFDEPERFDPDRWADGLIGELPRGAYFPFGDGPRICIGQTFAMLETTVVLVEILRKFRVVAVSDQPLELIASITLRPKSTIELGLEER